MWDGSGNARQCKSNRNSFDAVVIGSTTTCIHVAREGIEATDERNY